jgi:hypothetical protein
MSRYRWYIILAIFLTATSIATYFAQYFFFRDARNTIFYLFQDLAFVPVQVLLVMVFLDKLLQKKDKEALLNKMNMMIGVFFNEVGTGIMALFNETEKNHASLRKEMMINNTWNAKSFETCKKIFRAFEPDPTLNPDMLRRMKEYLFAHRDDMLRMLENPNLLEHDKFTDLLWAVFHLADELHHRPSFDGLPDTDINHLKGDLIRAYKLIVIEWLEYMIHLKKDYPYLFSIAIRTNPFDPDARIEVN